jgi:hypothetical protein
MFQPTFDAVRSRNWWRVCFKRAAHVWHTPESVLERLLLVPPLAGVLALVAMAWLVQSPPQAMDFYVTAAQLLTGLIIALAVESRALGLDRVEGDARKLLLATILAVGAGQFEALRAIWIDQPIDATVLVFSLVVAFSAVLVLPLAGKALNQIERPDYTSH